MTVYKTPTCGCCKAWVEHVQQAGFQVTVRDLADLAEVKAAFGVPAALQSCHTAQIGGYLVEGHVPADLVTRLLTREAGGARTGRAGHAGGLARHGRGHPGTVSGAALRQDGRYARVRVALTVGAPAPPASANTVMTQPAVAPEPLPVERAHASRRAVDQRPEQPLRA